MRTREQLKSMARLMLNMSIHEITRVARKLSNEELRIINEEQEPLVAAIRKRQEERRLARES